MEFYDVIRLRRSIRSYRPVPVPEDALERIAEAVNMAPTACNRQPFRIIVVKDPEKRAAICRVYKAAWLSEAPAIAVIVGNASAAWKRLEGDSIVDVDCAIAMEHLVLAATEEGLGTCWICAFDRAAADAALNLPKEEHSVAMTPVGYAKNTDLPPQSRKELSAIFEVVG